MNRILTLVALLACGCNREPQASSTQSKPPVAEAMVSQDARKSEIPSVVPKPPDQAALDRMILAGYTPHADHLHRPGVKACPLAQGNEAVM